MRSESEMLQVVHQLANRTRRRRRATLVASSAVLVVLVTAATFAFHAHAGDGETVQAQSTGDPTTTVADPNDTTVSDPTDTTPTSPNATSIDPGSPSTPTTRSTPPTSSPEVTTTPALLPDCDPSQVTTTLTTDRATYTSDQLVHVTLRYRNNSTVACRQPNGVAEVAVTDDGGRLMTTLGVGMPATEVPWIPGTDITANFEWNWGCIPGLTPPCPEGGAPAGGYHLTSLPAFGYPMANAQITQL